MPFNILILAASALVPLIIGFIWYHPSVLGKAWINASGLTEERIKEANMALVLGLSYLFSFFLSTAVFYIVVHQGHVMSILINEPGINDAGSEMNLYYTDFMNKYGQNFRTFKHGSFHGVIAGLFIALPIIGTGALFERRGFKYIAIHVGYWVVSLGLMGGIICQFA